MLSGRALQIVFSVILTAIGIQMLVTAHRRLQVAGRASAGVVAG
jgi:hypothetical protein